MSEMSYYNKITFKCLRLYGVPQFFGYISKTQVVKSILNIRFLDLFKKHRNKKIEKSIIVYYNTTKILKVLKN